ncbi:hypothetical protein LQE92_13880 [Lacrimispora sp. NSJ-141]|uniref:Uncharacterized protein n=1 Tax=Lientehia hominis TaxID=2897778 RepID=A0AAP2RKL0_9FIRM|nr:hypothetical protein [Lientehia hominis]MCD2493696.1 hypothetical protein [Lientehia hominis]
MKKVVLGSMMFLAGVLSLSIVLAGSMSNEWTVNGQFSSFWNISQYRLMPAFYCFIAIAVIGLVIAVWGLFDKKDNQLPS